MAEKSLEQRVLELEREQQRHKKLLRSLGVDKDFVSVSVAAKMLNTETHVIYRRIKKPDSKLGIHYIKNGTRYKINVEKYKELICFDDSAKLA